MIVNLTWMVRRGVKQATEGLPNPSCFLRTNKEPRTPSQLSALVQPEPLTAVPLPPGVTPSGCAGSLAFNRSTAAAFRLASFPSGSTVAGATRSGASFVSPSDD